MKKLFTFLLALFISSAASTNMVYAGAPSAGAPTATNITSNSVTLSSSIVSTGIATTVKFKYAVTFSDFVGANSPFIMATPVNSGSAQVSSVNITGLLPNTLYYIGVIVTNADGSGVSPGYASFTTNPSGNPTITNIATNNINTINSFFTFNGDNAITSTLIRYSTTSGALTTTVAGGLVASNTYAARINGLTKNTTYYYQVEATNMNGTTISPEQTFTTSDTDLIADFSFDNTMASSIGGYSFSPAGTYVADRAAAANKAVSLTATTGAVISEIPVGRINRTISFWYKLNTYPTSPASNSLFAYGENVQNQKFGAYLNSTNMYFQGYSADQTMSHLASSAVWHHAVFIFNEYYIKVYINDGGNNYKIDTYVPSLNTVSVTKLFELYGSTNGTVIDDLKIYKRAITGTEVNNLRLYNDIVAPDPKPAITNITTSNISQTTAIINYTLNAKNLSTVSTIKYGVTSNNLNLSANATVTTGTTDAAKSVSLTGLTSNTQYHFAVEATNSAGTTTSTTGSFITLAIVKPTITAITSVPSASSASINYTINANGTSSTSIVKYGLISGNLTSQVAGSSANGATPTSANITIPGLALNTDYFYQIEATNAGGTTTTTESTFKTLVTAIPVVELTFDNTLTDTYDATAIYPRQLTFVTNRHNVPNKAASTSPNGNYAVRFVNSPIGTADRTFSLWYKIDAVNALNQAVVFSFGLGARVMQISVNGIGTASPKIGFTDELSYYEIPYTTALNQWYHAAITISGGFIKIYINGVLLSTQSSSNVNSVDPVLTIGDRAGAIDDFRIYNVGLSAAEVVGLSDNVLPVNLISYTAKAQNQTAALNWKTASESNNSHFLVKRSSDGVNFAELAKINAASTNGASYNYKDTNPVNGINYYQLIQVDNDGATTDLGVKSVNFSLNASVSIYPNPTADKLYISDVTNSFNTAKIYDAQGKMVLTTSLKSDRIIDVSTLAKGVYVIKLSGNSNETRKFIKQ